MDLNNPLSLHKMAQESLSLHKLAREALSLQKIASSQFYILDYSQYALDLPKFTYPKDYLESVKNLYSSIDYYKHLNTSIYSNFVNLKDIFHKQQEIVNSIYKFNANLVSSPMPNKSSSAFKELTQNVFCEIEQIEPTENLIPQYEELTSEISSIKSLTLEQTLSIIGLILSILALIQSHIVSQQANPQLDRIESLLQQMVEIQSTQLKLLSTDTSE